MKVKMLRVLEPIDKSRPQLILELQLTSGMWWWKRTEVVLARPESYYTWKRLDTDEPLHGIGEDISIIYNTWKSAREVAEKMRAFERPKMRVVWEAPELAEPDPEPGSMTVRTGPLR